MNTDTPETDAAVKASNGQWSFVLKETCQRLERERDEAREALENYMTSTVHSCNDECKRPMCVLRRERDEAREALNEAHKYLKWIHDVADSQRRWNFRTLAKEGLLKTGDR